MADQSGSFTTVKKVYAYITRTKETGLEVLIFSHVDFPDAGLQVPGGTVEPGEDLKLAVKREVEEESGLTSFLKVKFLGESKYNSLAKRQIHHRHYFHLTLSEEKEEEFVHQVTGKGVDKDMRFHYKWISVAHAPTLAVNMDELLHLLE